MIMSMIMIVIVIKNLNNYLQISFFLLIFVEVFHNYYILSLRHEKVKS